MNRRIFGVRWLFGRMDLSVMKYLPTNFTHHELDVRDRCRFEINCETHHVEWHLV